MRRKDREVTDINNVLDIINSCKVFRIAMSYEDKPYIVPLNFGYSYENDTFEFYFHCASIGRKLDIMRNNPLVCFEMDTDHVFKVADFACGYSYYYKSIIGYGNAQIVDDMEEKKEYLNKLMVHQIGKEFTFTNEQASSVTVGKIVVTEISAKARAKQ